VGCAALPEVGPNGISLNNWFPSEEGPKSAEDVEWFQRALAEAEAFASRPVLVNMDRPFDVRQGRKTLCRWIAGEYQEGGPAWVAPDWKAPARKRRPKPTGMSVDEYEALLRDRLAAAGFDFRRPDHELACLMFLACGWEPVACDQDFLYYEARDDGIEFGRWFHHGPKSRTARHERVALRFSSPKLRGYKFRDAMGMCSGPDDASTFAKKLQKIFTELDRKVSRWRAEWRRYDPTQGP